MKGQVYGDYYNTSLGVAFSGGSADKESACNMGDLALIPGWGDLWEKGMATYSSMLAWRIPWTV